LVHQHLFAGERNGFLQLAKAVNIFTDAINDQYLPFAADEVKAMRNRAVIGVKIFVFACLGHWSIKMYYELYAGGLLIFNKVSNFNLENTQTMTAEQIKQYIQGGEWVSITPEVRPSISPSASGGIQPFYLTRVFKYPPGDKFECVVINYADANAKVPLVKIEIKGHNIWLGAHPIAEGAYSVNYVADIAYEVTPLHQGFADAINRIPTTVFDKWEVSVMQDVMGKPFPAFGLNGVFIQIMTWYMFMTACFSMAARTWMDALLINRRTGRQICRFR